MRRPSKARRVLLAWSSGKDGAWALHVLRQRADVEVAALFTTLDEATGRVGMHGVPRALVEAQAAAAGLPLWAVPMPWPCPNEVYERHLQSVWDRARRAGVTHVAYGDLFLEDVRAYREGLLEETGLAPLFPLWHPAGGTTALARAMVDGGLRAVLTCVDPGRLGASFLGAAYDEALLVRLSEGVDPCGEQGEFHTFCTAGPMFDEEVPVAVGAASRRDGFAFMDVARPAG